MLTNSTTSGPDSNLCKNLKEVVSRAPSTAEFCRIAGFNRQQFNKYLAGTHTPSRRSMLKIAEHCGLGIQDFLLPPASFVKRLDDRNATPKERAQVHAHFQMLETFARSSTSQLKPFLGTYFRHHYSSIYTGSIVRAVTVIYEDDDIVRYVTMESMVVSDASGKERCGFTYRGVCYLMGSRVFMCDYEHRQCNEMTTSILMPQFRMPIKYMFGLLTGIAATAYGQPFSTRVAYQRVSDAKDIRKHVLRQARLLSPEDESIPAVVKRYLSEAQVLFAEV